LTIIDKLPYNPRLYEKNISAIQKKAKNHPRFQKTHEIEGRSEHSQEAQAEGPETHRGLVSRPRHLCGKNFP